MISTNSYAERLEKSTLQRWDSSNSSRKHAISPSPLPGLWRVAWRVPNMRASNEGLHRPRVARAQGIARPHPVSFFFPSISSLRYWKGTRVPAIGRIGRAPFHRARSASKEAPGHSLFLLSRFPEEGLCLFPTARIERPRPYRGGSASTETSQLPRLLPSQGARSGSTGATWVSCPLYWA